jgi:hypothetical protein
MKTHTDPTKPIVYSYARIIAGQTSKNMKKVLFVLPLHDQLGNTGQKKVTGLKSLPVLTMNL